MMHRRHFAAVAAGALALAAAAPALADEYQDTLALFRKAEESGRFFRDAYGWAVFPKIGKGGIGVGGAYGKGRVYRQGKYIGDSSMTQLSIGFQLGAQGFSQIIFFQNAAALEEFTKGEYEVGAGVGAVAITLAAGAKAGSGGATAGASVEKDKARVVGAYNNGMAIFTLVRGGLMYEATVAGQKFTFTKR